MNRQDVLATLNKQIAYEAKVTEMMAVASCSEPKAAGIIDAFLGRQPDQARWKGMEDMYQTGANFGRKLRLET